MTKYCLAIFFLSVTTMAVSQQPELQWAHTFDAHNLNNYRVLSNGRSVAVDRHGNVYSAGIFNHTIDFDPGPGVFTLTASNWAETGIYISKLSSTGDFIWALQLSALVEFGNIEISVDKDDNVYLASELRDATDMDPGPGVYMLTPFGAVDAFVAKYDTNGNLVWAKQFGGSQDTAPRSDGLDIDDNNNVIICGNFYNAVDFDPGPNTFAMTASPNIQSFIVKLDSNGDFIWAKQFGNSPLVNSSSNIADVKCDKLGNIYTVGDFSGDCDFDTGPGTFTLEGTSLRDGYIAKLDPTGELVWARRIGNTSNEFFDFAESRGIAVDSENNVYTAGNFAGPFDFDPGPDTHIVTADNYDWYVLKLNGQGDFKWVSVFGGSEIDFGADVAVDRDGSVYTVGGIGHVADMDPGPGTHTITTVNQYGASVLTKLNSNGSFIYAAPFESIGTDYGESLTRRMVIDNSQNIYITGYVSGTIDFDPGPRVYPLSSGMDQSPFVMKLGKCKNPTTSTLNINACNSYTLNTEIFDLPGTYIRTIPNTAGCDSIITLHLTINKKTTEQNIAICEGSSFFAGGADKTLSGTYTDTLQTSLNCDSIVTTHLTVHPVPLPNLGIDRDLCAGTQAVINPGLFTSYLWQDMSNAPDFTIQAPGKYWVKVTNSFNCSATDSFIVRSILPSPANFLKETDSVCNNGKLQIASSGVFNTYLWSTGEGQNIVLVDKPGKYWLNVKDANGCEGTDSISVFEKECMSGVYIPLAFTPNRDGRNDIFKANVFGELVSFKLQVFDRGGQLIFQTTDPGKGWNGLNKGQSYPTTVFVWQCFYQFSNQQPGYQKGTVMIVH